MLTNQTVHNALGIVSAWSPSYLAVRAFFAGAGSAVWNTDDTHEVFTVHGLVRLRMWVTVEDDVDSTGHAATVTFGHELDPDLYITATDEEALDTDELWYDNTPTTFDEAFSTAVFDRVVNDLDIGYEIDVEALSAGALVFHCVWEPLETGAAVVAGVGGTL